MLFKKGKRFWAGLCVCSMLVTSVAENSFMVTAAENTDSDLKITAVESQGTVPKAETNAEANEAGNEATHEGEDVIVENSDYTLNETTGVLTFKAGLTGVPDNAFNYTASQNTAYVESLSKIKVIQFEENSQAKLLGNSSFKSLPNLEKIDLSNCSSLTTIYENAFLNCTKVSEIILPEDLLEIKNSAFQNCKEVQSIRLNSKLTTMGNSVFSGCSKLSAVTVETNNLTCGNNVFYNCSISQIQFANKNTVVPSNLFNGATFVDGMEVVIPYFIQEIGGGAFSRCTNLKKVTFENTEENPSALASIAKNAFSECKVLESVEFPNSLKVIEEGAYQNCEKLTVVDIPNTVTMLGKNAFKGCSGIKTLKISNAISSLGESVFEGCTSLESVEVPSGIGEISGRMFARCTSLSSISIPNTVTSVGNSAFEDCGNLPSIVLPDTVKTVGNAAFKKCKILNNPVMPKELDSYSASLFEGCTALSIISTSAQTGDEAKGLEIPKAVTFIGSSAFNDCDGIKKVLISENVTTIHAKAFADCQMIDTVKIDTLKLQDCGAGIFQSDLIREVIFPENITEIPASLFSAAGFNTTAIITIPATVTKIGKSAFGGINGSNVTNISRIVFEEGSKLETIEESAFQYCTAIKEFTIPDTVTKIGNNAFLGCKNLMQITVPEKVTEIGTAAFKDCEVLTTVHFNAVEVRTVNKDIFKNCNIHTILIGDKVTILPAYLFYGAKFSTNSEGAEVKLITLNIPASVGEIGAYAFSNITNLSKVYFAEHSQLKAVGTYAFNECTALTECNLPDGVETIGNAAFKGCSNLQTMHIPENLTALGNYAFYQVVKIENYVIPEGVTGILDNTFYGNTALKGVTFEGYEITKIGNNAFTDCVNLEKVEIPSGTTSIGNYAFSADAALQEVCIPASVTSIGTDAFKDCSNATFYVVSGSYAEQWLKANGFASQISLMNTITYVLDGGENDIRNIGGYRDGDSFTFYDATKAGYSFEGWYKENTFKTKVTDLSGCSGDFTLYAKWVEGVYKITYVLDGGENSADNPDTYTYYEGAVFADPVKTGYRFYGWYDNPDFKGNKITTIKAQSRSGDIKLYAKWQAKTVNVTFVDESKKGIVEFKNLTVTYDSTYGSCSKTGDLPIATRENYIFDGWYTEDGVLVTKDSLVQVDKNHSLYVKWVLDVRVEAPVADVVSGSRVDKGSKVILSTETPGADIYYNLITCTTDGEDFTTDGSDIFGNVANPTTGSIRYTEPITIEENTIIKAIGVREGFKNSEVSSFVYTVQDETTFWGDIVPEDRLQFQNGDEVPEGIWIAGVEDKVYTGSAIKFDVRVYSHKTLLTEKKDYTIKYSNNKDAASVTDKKAPTVTVTGKGNYKGKSTVKFNILPADINSVAIEAEEMWLAVKSGKVQKPVPVVIYGKTKLKNGKDFRIVAYYDEAGKQVGGCMDAGVYSIEICGLKNYAGTSENTANTRKITCTLTNANLMSKAKITCAKTVNYNNGEPVEPVVTVKFGGNILQKDTHYTVEYRNNRNVGTATAVITGKGDYAGTKKVTFKIAPTATINKAKITIAAVPYKGSPYTVEDAENPLKVSVSYQGLELERGTDYVIDSYNKNTDAGTATVVFRGINKYSGTVKKTFKITAVDIDTLACRFVDEEGKVVNSIAAPYAKNGAKPTLYLTYNDKALKVGTDYTVSYKNNKKLGQATLVIKGKKNFKGSIKDVPFTVVSQDIGKLSLNVEDIVGQKEPGNYMVKPVITDLDGKKLSAGKDYSSKIVYTYAYDCAVWEKGGNINLDPDKMREGGTVVKDTDILPVGTTLKVTIAAAGNNYTGKLEGLYRVVEKGTLAKAKVKIAQQSYTGKAVCPGKGKGGIESVTVNGVELKPEQYEIVGYGNNVARGNATVTLRGTGEYGGTITVKFKIVQRNLIFDRILEKFGLR